MAFSHIPVLLNETLTGLNINPDGIYVDATFGRGGHSREILKRLSKNGRLYALDRDLSAIEAAKSIDDERFSIVHARFSQLKEVCEDFKILGKVNGILMDIGVSSPQLDDASRGFSFDKDGPLDMRMDQSAKVYAALIVNTYDAKDLAYIFNLCLLISGTCILAFGITLAVIADVSMVSGEYFVKIVAQKTHKEFGVIKTIFDVSLVILAVILSLIFTGFTQIEGVREGTVIGALCVGPLVRVFLPRLKWISIYLKDKNSVPNQTPTAHFCNVITIAREYGCGGRIIGKMIAQKLGYEFYDTNLIELIAKESGFSEQTVSKNEEMDSALLYEMIMQDYTVPLNKSMSRQDMLYVASSKVIRNIASKHNCVIVGRCADYILKDNPNCYNVFLFADTDKKLDFCLKEYHEAHDVAFEKMQQSLYTLS